MRGRGRPCYDGALMSERQKAVLALIVVLLLWCLPTVFVKFFMPYYDPFTQNFFRYASGALFMLPLLVWRLRSQRRSLARRELWRLMIPTLPNVVHQTGWVFAMQWVYPALTSFLNKSSILFAAVMAYLFFPEERWVFRSGRFVGGMLLTVAGTLGLALLRPDLGEMKINAAVLLVVFSASMWATYSVTVKKIAPSIGSTISFATVSVYTTVVLLVPALIWGDLSAWMRAPWQVNVLVVLSGVLCIGLGHTLYYYALKVIGVSICATTLLVTPVGTLLLSKWIFDEQLTPGQIVSGVILLAGGALTMMAKEKPPVAVAKAAEAAHA
jgi:drug/metabolite transporter (DMT)-like permease